MSDKSKHPAGLKVLFFTEMWERFGFYLLLGILQLYLMDAEHGGMAMGRRQAADIFGTFIALVYLTPFLGGMIADKKWGYKRSITIGGILMGIGYSGLALNTLPTFYISLALIIIGNGFFKPNISTLVGNLYNDDRYRGNKDNGYNIFYMGINIGAFICNFFAAFLRNSIGWGAAFLAAGIGMFIGVIIFNLGKKTYEHADVLKPAQAEDMSIARVFSNILLPAVIAGIVGWMIPGNLLGSDSNDAFIFAAIPVVYYFFTLFSKAGNDDKKPIGALLTIFLVSVMFWAIFKQNGTVLTTWAEYYTDRHVVPTLEKPLASIYMVEQKENVIGDVIQYDDKYRVIKENGVAVTGQGKDIYFRNVAPADMPHEGDSLHVLNTELFQSVNPFWVIALTPLLVMFWGYLRRKNREPGTASKIAIGMFVTALSTLLMVGAVIASQNGLVKAGPLWLIGTYGIITIGELCLSPMGLSLVSKLSPPRMVGLMMGGWFLATSIGNKLSGMLAGLWDMFTHKSYFFMMNFGLLIFALVVYMLMLKRVSKVMKERGIR